MKNKAYNYMSLKHKEQHKSNIIILRCHLCRICYYYRQPAFVARRGHEPYNSQLAYITCTYIHVHVPYIIHILSVYVCINRLVSEAYFAHPVNAFLKD